MMETPTSYSSNRRALQLKEDNPVCDTRSHRIFCHDNFGQSELLNGLFPAAGYGFIPSPSTLNDRGVSAKRTFDFFSFLSFPFLIIFKRRSQYLHEGRILRCCGQKATTSTVGFLADHTHKNHKTSYI
jgi:hypothetical protein